MAERFAPGHPSAYQCNLELVGQFEGEGSAGYLESFDKSVYYTTWNSAKMRHPAVPVIDVADSRNPRVTDYLTTPAMLNANEALEIDRSRKLLLANLFNGSIYDIYDLSIDCRHPVLKGSLTVPGTTLHSGTFSPDGLTLYGTSGLPGRKTILSMRKFLDRRCLRSTPVICRTCMF